MPVEEYNLSNQREAMAALEAERQTKKIGIVALQQRSGISMNSFYAWKSCTRSPVMRHVTALAAAFGFEVVMRRVAPPGEEYDMRELSAAMAVLEAERRAKNMRLGDMEERSGVSVNSVYAWRSRARSPSLCNAVAIAQTFGFEIIMRRDAPEQMDKQNEFKF